MACRFRGQPGLRLELAPQRVLQFPDELKRDRRLTNGQLENDPPRDVLLAGIGLV